MSNAIVFPLEVEDHLSAREAGVVASCHDRLRPRFSRRRRVDFGAAPHPGLPCHRRDACALWRSFRFIGGPVRRAGTGDGRGGNAAARAGRSVRRARPRNPPADDMSPDALPDPTVKHEIDQKKTVAKHRTFAEHAPREGGGRSGNQLGGASAKEGGREDTARLACPRGKRRLAARWVTRPCSPSRSGSTPRQGASLVRARRIRLPRHRLGAIVGIRLWINSSAAALARQSSGPFTRRRRQAGRTSPVRSLISTEERRACRRTRQYPSPPSCSRSPEPARARRRRAAPCRYNHGSR